MIDPAGFIKTGRFFKITSWLNIWMHSTGEEYQFFLPLALF